MELAADEAALLHACHEQPVMLGQGDGTARGGQRPVAVGEVAVAVRQHRATGLGLDLVPAELRDAYRVGEPGRHEHRSCPDPTRPGSPWSSGTGAGGRRRCRWSAGRARSALAARHRARARPRRPSPGRTHPRPAASREKRPAPSRDRRPRPARHRPAASPPCTDARLATPVGTMTTCPLTDCPWYSVHRQARSWRRRGATRSPAP